MWWLLAWGGCGAAESCLEEPIELACGMGRDGLAPLLTDGATATLVAGPQGGWHIWTSIEAVHSDETVTITPTVTVPRLDDVQIGAGPSGIFYALTYDEEACSGTHFGVEARLVPTVLAPDELQVICGLEGETLHLRVVVADVDDPARSATCEADVIVALGPEDEERCG